MLREGGREERRGREVNSNMRDKHVCSTCPDWELSWQSFSAQDYTQPIESLWPG